MRKYKNFCSPTSHLNTLYKITLTQFRNYGLASFSFPDKITCITGPNGSGKTNLLDAIYYLCYTKSYFTAQQQHTVQSGTDGFRVEGEFRQADREETIVCKWKAGKKEVIAGGAVYERMADHIGKYAAVIIAPDDLELVNDGSELRRRWMDGILSQTDKQYLDTLLQYQRVLLQRNGWLKIEATQSTGNNHALEYYNHQLTKCSEYLYLRRKEFLNEFLPLLNDFYHRLSEGKEAVQINYTSDLHEHPLEYYLLNNLQQDLRMQRTLKGSHKDDLQFEIGGMLLKQYGSQGQKKSFLFALKLAQYKYLRKHMGHLPILLLDDIFEKLDQHRMESLLRIIQSRDFGQVIVTDTHAERVIAAFGNGVEVGMIRLQ